MKYRMARALILLTVVTICSAELSMAANGNVTKELRRGKSFSVKARNCTLSLLRERSRLIIIRCGGASASTSQRASVTLRRGKRATIKGDSCFLGITSRTDSRIAVRCFRVRPTATPTPTATATATATVTPTPTATLTPNAQALAANNVIISFNTSDPANSATVIALSGVTSPQTLVSIDRRPQNGALYGLGYNATTGEAQLYRISVPGAVVAAVGTPGSFVDGSANPVRIGTDELTKIGIDFNPTVDRLRVVTNNSQNFRMNPNSGGFVDGDGGVSGTNMDGAISGGTTTVSETAYTNSVQSASVTTQYTLDAATDSLYIQNPPNSGTQTSAVPLVQNSATLDAVEIRGFDIPGSVSAPGSATPVAEGSGSAIIEFASNSQQRYAEVNLVSGVVSNDANVGDGTSDLLGLALQSASAAPVVALTENGNLLRFRANAPDQTASVAVSGLTSGESLIGIDFRPATGQLYGLGVDPAADTGTLYLLDPQTGAATAVGTPSAVTNGDLPTAATGYGFNFNPTVDRIRVVTASGLNFRLNPVSGLIAAVDSAINGDASGVHATAYTNSFNGATATTQYTIDATGDALLIQNPPNAGTQVAVGALGIDIDAVAALEVPSTVTTETSGSVVASGAAFAAFEVGGVTSLYTVNLNTGVATLIGSIGDGSVAVQGLAVGEVEAR